MIDLHIHTKYSDGKKSLIDILKLADFNNLECISITDHDNVDAYYELSNIDYKKYFKGDIIKGVEIRSIFNKVPIEILAYNYDLDKIDKYLDYTNQKVKTATIEQFEHLSKVCRDIGIKTSDDISLSEDCYFTDVIFDDINGYEENIRLLEEHNITSSYNLYRAHMCNIDSIFFFDNSKYVDDIKDVINAIHYAGGIAILAHPFNVYKVINNKKFLSDILSLNILDGLECIHKCLNEEESKYLIDICKSNNLYITGGSDYHNANDKLGYSNYRSNLITKDNMNSFLEVIS